MPYPKSIFGERLTASSGILELMDDLGRAMATDRDMIMMGGGNPSHVPAVQQVWREKMLALVEQDASRFDAMLADYDGPAGSPRFRHAIADLLNREFGWSLTEKNVGITSGGQTAFFFLLNRLAGDFGDGTRKRILFPLMPEYIGYANQSVGAELFTAIRPRIELLENRRFKYRIDFDRLHLSKEIAAVCVSRPTNPSSNVLTNGEVAHLAELTREAGIPLLIDNAYGVPFPGVVFEDADPVWDEHIILTLSLSKLGLPGTRTGIVIAREELIADVAAMTAIAGLANGNIGQALTLPLVESGEILKLSKEVIRPFYQEKSAMAQALLEEHLPADRPWKLHRSEGAFFLWLWFDELPIPTRELYQRLKARRTVIVPGEYFFYGLEDAPGETPWPHASQCIRLSYAPAREVLEKGIRILGEEVAKAYAEGGA